MGRLYGGNLNAFKAACNRLYQLDFAVIADDWRDAHLRQECMRLRVEDRAGNIFALETFSHYDEDVLFNTATSFLNGLADQLDTWSKA
ncbi:inhibitor of dGTPase [Escherichia phage Pisces]|uniref:Inhibitor of dGTPase n=1 Tax=Escherichia phage Pisces TaxID=2591102 RepID=A0A5B9N6B5_9CAUD|nr:inhibitor of dGTPase [Escherichia phage Pisces]